MPTQHGFAVPDSCCAGLGCRQRVWEDPPNGAALEEFASMEPSCSAGLPCKNSPVRSAGTTAYL